MLFFFKSCRFNFSDFCRYKVTDYNVFFQKDRNGQVRGYGLVDHSGRIAFDGSKIMKLSDLIDFAPKQQRQPSPLDVYRNLFTAEIGREGLKDYVSIRMKDGSSYKTPISARQAAWYNGVKPEEQEDVALRIAATMFQEQILIAYLNQVPDINPAKTIKNVSALKQRDGSFAYRITHNHNSTLILSLSVGRTIPQKS